ncbi:hypothetical protein CIB84_005437, partial [Bambusicola thoracicus]
VFVQVTARNLNSFYLSALQYNTSPLSNGQKSSMTEDSWADDITHGHLLSTAAMPLRVPVSKPRDLRQQSGSSTAIQKSSLELQRCVPDNPLETLSVVSEDALPPQFVGKPQSHQKENGKKQSEGMEAQEAFLDSCLFRESLCATQQNLNDLSALAQESHPLPYEDETHSVFKRGYQFNSGNLVQCYKGQQQQLP